MNLAYLSTVSALAGTVIGGVTTFATSWLTHTAQVKSARLAAERARREELYGRYAEELALLYSFALGEEGLSYSKLVTITGLRGRIILLATPAVIESAERAVNLIIDLYQGPRLTREEVRQRIENKSLNAIGEFARCCREELIALRLV
ncbi:hypothetical protein [Acidisoma cladoniae]|jgi:hypothetical protein|uniref:hypothetical protein n=1 Tax=Acidisoma cladoniae TaxID=3040935 RepID=UPI00255102E9|nr:hypothetical protein [Acidisoma sp. PAMC 29798]